MEAIKNAKAFKIAVFVVREYGGQEIGGARFKHIQDCAEKALEKAGVK